ncbi:MAG: hypothetical protein KF686_10865 [Ramlibacter sp.]|nr:hypothetical protein [Ramlibacter sp.]
MAHQFIHYESYGLQSRNKKSTASGVVAEAERVPTHSKHVATPKRPKLVFGCNPSEVLAEVTQSAALAKDRSGKRKLPKDAKVLLAGVVSMPLKTEALLEAHKAFVLGGKKVKNADLRLYDKWLSLTVSFLKGQYGAGLRSVVLHYDEEYVHLHYFAANRLTDGTLNLDGLDVAGDAERALGHDRKARNESGAARKKARGTALRDLQDAFFKAVGQPLGWLRLGPKNPRMTREQYSREKRSAQALKEANDRAEALEAEVANLSGRLAASRQMYAEAVEKTRPQIQALTRSVQALRLAPDLEELKRVEAETARLAATPTPKPKPKLT